MSLSYEVGTKVTPEGIILSTITLKHQHTDPAIRDMVSEVSRKVINTQEEQIRQALIKLGWTPPPPDFKPEES